VFFDSSCPYCENIAPHWSGIRKLELNGASVHVDWIGVLAEDPGAREYVNSFSPGSGWLRVPSDRARGELGAFGTPLAYIIGPDRVFHGRTAVLPREIVEFPEACRHVAGAN